MARKSLSGIETNTLKVTTSPTSGYVLTSDASGNATWQAPSGGGGTGDVVGPSSSTTNTMPIYDGTTGKLLKNGVLSATTGTGYAQLSSANGLVLHSPDTLSLSGTDGITIDAGDIDANGFKILNLGAPSNPNDAATKSYVDSNAGANGLTRNVVTTSGNFTAGATPLVDYIYLISGAHTPTLPTASGNTSRYTFKNNHSASITINRAGSDTIEGATSLTISPSASVDLISNGSNAWYVI